MNLKELQNFQNTGVGNILNVVRLFGGYSPIPPLAAFLILTYRCNLNCHFCFQSRERREAYPDMSIEDVRLIEENFRKSFFYKPRIHLFGGEPTINRDFPEIVKYLGGKGYRLSLTTNGVGIHDCIEPLLAVKARVEINMSINTMNFEEQLSALQLFEKHDVKKRIYVNIACPINRDNQHNLAEIIRKFENSYARCITLQHSIFIKNRIPDLNPVQLKKQVEEIKRKRYRRPVMFFPDIKAKDIEEYYMNPDFPDNSNRCVLPWFLLIIQPNGDVLPCEEIEAVIGNAKRGKLSRIWNGREYREFRQKIQQNGLSHPACYRCCHRKYY
jgi:radical SAM protein with 4Fe4S-binding SPASM domain